MIPSTFTLLVAATNLALSVNALPIFSGFFAAPAAHAPSVQKRDLTDGQLAQGTNAFFRSLLLEDICTPGQVGCINNNTATCSPEGNWEVTPCPSSTTCLALPATPDSSSQSLVVKCTTQDSAVSAIEQAGGSQDVAVDYSITAAPFNATVADVPDNGSNSTDTNTNVPTNTDSFTDVPTATDSFTDVPTDVPTGTDAATTPTGVCTDEPSEPTETEYITVIAFPDPSNTDSFTFSTIEPTDAATITLPDESSPTDTISQVAPVDAPTDTTTDTAVPTDTTTDTSVPTGTDAGVAPTDTPTDTAPCTDAYTDSPTATETDIATATGTDYSGEPTTLVVPPNFSIATGPVPDINTIGTFAIPATPSAPVPIRRSGRMMQRKVRRS